MNSVIIINMYWEITETLLMAFLALMKGYNWKCQLKKLFSTATLHIHDQFS